MPQDTMGADGAFDRRRQELAILRRCDKGQVSDADVVQSYRDECDPAKPEGNFMLQYLQEGALGCVFGRALFVHGGLDAATVGAVPAAAGKEPRVRAWVKKLNAWAQSQIAEFVGDPYSYAQPDPGYAEAGGGAAVCKGWALTDYGVPGGNGGATVVYKSFLCNGNGDGPAVIHPFKASHPELRRACLRMHAPQSGSMLEPALSASYLRRCSSVLGLWCRHANASSAVLHADCELPPGGDTHCAKDSGFQRHAR